MGRWEPPGEQVVAATRPPRWPMILLLLALVAVSVAGLLVLRRRMQPTQPSSELSRAAGVRSDISPAGDSLDVVVSWRLTEVPAAGLADSVRVEVGLGDGGQSRTEVSASTQRADTLRIPAPAAGETVAGYSCVAAVHGPRLSRESCTPWQYVRPAAQLPTAPLAEDSAAPAPSRAETRRRAGASVVRVVVQPAGQQVDPDVGGRCAAWQRRNPSRPIWIEVNQEAVPECMGPNGKPTVAQFCAFALLADGRRVKTANSTSSYCERLYQAWIRERTT